MTTHHLLHSLLCCFDYLMYVVVRTLDFATDGGCVDTGRSGEKSHSSGTGVCTAVSAEAMATGGGGGTAEEQPASEKRRHWASGESVV